MIVGKKCSAQWHHNGSVRAKTCFRKILLDHVGMNIGKCRISINPQGYLIIAGDVSDISNVLFEQFPEAAISHGASVTIY